MPGRVWGIALLLVVVGLAGPAAAQPAGPLAPAPPPDLGVSTPASFVPPPVLGAPVAAEPEPVRPASASTGMASASRSSSGSLQPRPPRAATLAPPTTATPIPSTVVETPVRPASGSGPASDPVGDLLNRRAGGLPPPDQQSRKFGEKLTGAVGERTDWFRSDHAYDGLISPMTNPFLFEDPRSLTEVRPLFIYQRIPGGQPDFYGGSVSFFGTQARLAITNRWSFTLNKLGGIWLNPNDPSPIPGGSSFSEIWLGPKFTFIRSDAGLLFAGGLQFQFPAGNSLAFQNTSGLSLVPYVSYGQNLFKDSFYQGVNVMATTGYSFGTSSSRSDYFFLSGHIDIPVCITETVRWYPLFEMNYFLTTSNGTAYPIGIEGRDLINFGGQAQGHGLLTGALGSRFKVTEAFQFGAAFEIPFAGPRDLMQYRFTVDFIWRY